MFKINLSDKSGKTYKIEVEAEQLIDKKLHDTVQGKDIDEKLDGFEFEITGTSDKAGFTSMKGVQGIGLKKVLLGYGKAMKKRPKKEGKIKRSNKTPKGLRLRKTVRGEIISSEIIQINLKVLKEDKKPLKDIFAPEKPAEESVKETKPVEEAKPKEKPVEKTKSTEETKKG